VLGCVLVAAPRPDDALDCPSTEVELSASGTSTSDPSTPIDGNNNRNMKKQFLGLVCAAVQVIDLISASLPLSLPLSLSLSHSLSRIISLPILNDIHANKVSISGFNSVYMESILKVFIY
jgi:hypothetical protein